MAILSCWNFPSAIEMCTFYDNNRFTKINQEHFEKLKVSFTTFNKYIHMEIATK